MRKPLLLAASALLLVGGCDFDSPPPEFNSLNASPNTIFVGQSTPITFVADIPLDARLIRESVSLLREQSGSLEVAAAMNDDGTGPDAIAGDNRFTATIDVLEGEHEGVSFRASAAYRDSVRRVQSSPLAVQVLPALSLQINAGQQEITLLKGESASTAFTIQVGNQAGSPGTVSASQTIEPDSGVSVTSDLPSGGFVTDLPNQTFLVQNSILAQTPGEYRITLDGTLSTADGTTSESASILVRVLPESGIGHLSLSAHPGAVPASGGSGTIAFGANYSSGVASPNRVLLFEVSATGDSLDQIGAMRDDGQVPDLGASDLLFSLEANIPGGTPGSKRHFRAMATFDDGGATHSEVLTIPALPYPIGFAPVDGGSTITDDESETEMSCDQVLIEFTPETSLAQIQSVVDAIDGSILGVEAAINSYQVKIPCTNLVELQAILEALNGEPMVAVASPNTISQVDELVPNDSLYGSQYAPPLVRADESWLIARGSGVVVAVLDTGVDYTHPDLSSSVVAGGDYVNGDADPQDDHSHGTHVAGIAAANGNNGTGVSGIAWDATVLAIKVCGGKVGVPGVGKAGGCPTSAITSGLLEATAKARIANLSLGHLKGFVDGFLDLIGVGTALQRSIAKAVGSGVLVVASAGNNNTSDTYVPCAYSGVLCVGNTTASDVRYVHPMYGSNYGDQVDIAAPGTSILSPVPGFGSGPTYGSKTGTSMAAPLVAGVAALVWSENPTWTRIQVADRLTKTGVPLPGQQVGPRVDAFDAVFNGSFEHDLSGWQVAGTGSAVDRLGPINPTKAQRMGMASTGPDGAVSDSELFQEFEVKPGVSEIAISFSYAMVTEEYPEWINRGYNDEFRVTLELAGGGSRELALETVDGSAFSPIGGIDFPGGDSTVGWTGWKTVTSEIVPVAPGGGVYRLRVSDRGDGIYDTNGILDNIRFE